MTYLRPSLYHAFLVFVFVLHCNDVLQEENLNLRLRLKVGDEAEDAEKEEILEIKSRLDDMVSRGVAEAQILQTMDLLKERFADYGRWELRRDW